MSSTELYKITQSGRIIFYQEFKNSHRGAYFVWSNLWQYYCKDRIAELKKKDGFEYHSPSSNEDFQMVWGLHKNKEINKSVRAVLMSTFDYVVLEKNYFQRYFDDVLKYAEYFPAGSLIDQAQAILRLKSKNVMGVCWNQTSVSADMWYNEKGSSNIKDFKYWYFYLYHDLEEIDSEVMK